MRVTQQMMYGNFLLYMNNNLSDLMESNLQSSSQKRINRPSDDPVGTARVLDLRTSLSGIATYQKNIDTAKGWLNLADTTLLQVSDVITQAKGIAEQAATGTLSKENREQISYQARQLFEQLVSLANTSYDNKSIFAGHKVDKDAFAERLWATASDNSLDNGGWTIEGSADKTVLVQFTDTAAASGGSVSNIGSATLGYRYSTDGGQTFTSVNGPIPVSGGKALLNLGGVKMTLDAGTQVTTTSISNPNDDRGTWFWVRPTAQYMGDDKDSASVDEYGTQTIAGQATGSFPGNVTVRIDSGGGSLLGPILYSYSMDNGNTWTTGNIMASGVSSNAATLVVPGGILTLSSNGGNTLFAGDQFVIHPRMADIKLRIAVSEEISINNVGKDIFGGVYQDPNASNASLVFGNDAAKNLFDVMGRLVGYLETNNQTGIQGVLEDLDKAHSQVLNQAANVAGRENRLTVAGNVLSSLKLNDNERLGSVEDIDLGELLTKMAQQQLAYETVLKSSSMIMKMTLTNYL
ncbi:flagellar hook-associated protein 3 [Desulfovibrio sp. X2]|uniref:flagellar hook-associated protein FlgL n=1 Tax=Desulfovibrio sp. X2 TaxID=941449 RepID=UPI00035892DC|nr:flagellar hook-associated protein FlgL [Desulfovibrio sp. X2]EPR41708.1 flagellar hook-associated protein 3 [Desulfovibrio sp. X2]